MSSLSMPDLRPLCFLQPAALFARCQRSLLCSSLLLGLSWGNGAAVFAQSAPSSTVVPNGLEQAIENLDQVSTQENLEGTLSYYSQDFQDADGLTRSALASVLESFWERYSDLSYNTTINSAQQSEAGWIVETTSTITGTEIQADRTLNLSSEIQARQTWKDNQLVYQEILSEQTQITSGEAPPTLSMHLPNTVAVNEKFHLDVIVEEPIREDLVLGAIVDEPVGSDRFMTPAIAEFQPLVSGGIFKIGQAPDQPDNRWISAVVIRKGGITLVTQRLRIVATQ